MNGRRLLHGGSKGGQMVAETPQGIRVGGAYRILEEPGGLGVLHGDTQDGNRQKTPGYMGMCRAHGRRQGA